MAEHEQRVTESLLAFLFWQAVLGLTGAVLPIPLTFLLKKIWLALSQRDEE